MQPPETRFVHTDVGAIAFQEWGEGDTVILNLGEWAISVDTWWEHPGHLRLWDVYASIGRSVLFDYRGLGVSDAVPLAVVGDPAGWRDDALAVLDHLGIERVVVVGEGTAAAAAVLLAVAAPERVERLVLSNCAPCGALLEGRSEEDIARVAERVREHWGTGAVIAAGATGLAGDRSQLARFERIGARPAVAARMIEVVARVDIRPYLPQVEAPTFVMHTGDLSTVDPERTRAVADAIPGAVFVADQSTSFYWGGASTSWIDFLAGHERSAGERDLVAVLFTDIVGSTEEAARLGDDAWRETLRFLDGFVDRHAAANRGRVVKQTGDGHLIEFARPTDAIKAASVIVRGAPTLGVELRAGVHFGEVERRPNGDLGGIGVHVGARVGALAGAGEILVTRTVVDTAAGGGWAFEERGTHCLKGVPGEWPLFATQLMHGDRNG